MGPNRYRCSTAYQDTKSQYTLSARENTLASSIFTVAGFSPNKNSNRRLVEAVPSRPMGTSSQSVLNLSERRSVGRREGLVGQSFIISWLKSRNSTPSRVHSSHDNPSLLRDPDDSDVNIAILSNSRAKPPCVS